MTNALRLMTLLLLCVVLAGCQGTPLRQRAEQIDDVAVAGNIDFLCNMAPVGAVRRNFDTPEKRAAWISLCAIQPNAEFVLPHK